jgi:hypothetical protein
MKDSSTLIFAACASQAGTGPDGVWTSTVAGYVASVGAAELFVGSFIMTPPSHFPTFSLSHFQNPCSSVFIRG